MGLSHETISLVMYHSEKRCKNSCPTTTRYVQNLKKKLGMFYLVFEWSLSMFNAFQFVGWRCMYYDIASKLIKPTFMGHPNIHEKVSPLVSSWLLTCFRKYMYILQSEYVL